MKLLVEYGILFHFADGTDDGQSLITNEMFLWMEAFNAGDVLLNRIWLVEGGISQYSRLLVEPLSFLRGLHSCRVLGVVAGDGDGDINADGGLCRFGVDDGVHGQ